MWKEMTKTKQLKTSKNNCKDMPLSLDIFHLSKIQGRFLLADLCLLNIRTPGYTWAKFCEAPVDFIRPESISATPVFETSLWAFITIPVLTFVSQDQISNPILKNTDIYMITNSWIWMF